jgi:hypothetical protein
LAGEDKQTKNVPATAESIVQLALMSTFNIKRPDNGNVPIAQELSAALQA